MRRLVAPVALLAAALALAGCAGTPSAPEAISAEAFHEKVLALPAYKALGPEATDELAQTICDTLGKAKDEESRKKVVDYFVAMQEDSDNAGADAAVFVGAAIARFCPALKLQ